MKLLTTTHLHCTFATELWNMFRTLTGVKLCALCPRTLARDLLESSFCSEEERGVIQARLWLGWLRPATSWLVASR